MATTATVQHACLEWESHKSRTVASQL